MEPASRFVLVYKGMIAPTLWLWSFIRELIYRYKGVLTNALFKSSSPKWPRCPSNSAVNLGECETRSQLDRRVESVEDTQDLLPRRHEKLAEPGHDHNFLLLSIYFHGM